MEAELKILQEKGYNNLNKEEVKRYSYLKHEERKNKHKTKMSGKEISKNIVYLILFFLLVYLTWFILHLIPAVPLAPVTLFELYKNPLIWNDLPTYLKSVIFVSIVIFVILIIKTISDLIKRK